MHADWHREFFQGLAVEFWAAAVPPAQTMREVAFLCRELAPPPGGRLLDVPCGQGRHALELARRGWRVTGVDLSPTMLRLARAAAQAGPETAARLEWVAADLEELPELGSFDGAYCLGNSFGYLEAPRMLRFLRRLAASLKPGARFLADSGALAESLIPNLQERFEVEAGGIRMQVENRYDAAAGRLETRYVFERGGVREERGSWHWVFTAGELRRMFREAGLTPTGLYGSWERTPFELGSPMAILVAERIG